METPRAQRRFPSPAYGGKPQANSLYLAAENEAQVGGDLYAATRIEGGTRVMSGDVRWARV
ncbi:hypothetical protein ACGFWI_25535 [Streptomyces sp. NPDC048434]|uniref:hypothetical protein n=1 Tax=Streptomyces sp. NPDC048434 TaxID=3365549 RepID=UPI00370F856D